MSEAPQVEIPKTMLILKSTPTALGTVETFLRNRGWKIYSTVNLKEALVQIMSQKPSYVLISVDHTNKKVRALPKLLAQAFPVATIVFAENQSSVSYKALNEAATEYRVYPPVTGPAIERAVNKYIKDQQTRATVQSANESLSGDKAAADNSTISIKGGSNDNTTISGSGAGLSDDSTRRLLSQFLGDEGGITQAALNKADSNLVFAQPLEDDGDPGPSQGFVPGGQTGRSPQDDLLNPHLKAKAEADAKQSGQNGFGKTYVQKGSDGNIGKTNSGNDDLGGNWGNAKNDGPNGSAGNAKQDNLRGENGWGAQGGNPNADSAAKQVEKSGTAHDGLGSREYRRAQNAPAWAPVKDDDANTIRVKDKLGRNNDNDTLIARGTQKSLEESVEIRDGVVTAKLEDTTSAACIVVESERFSGYLVAVMGKNRKIDKEFIETIKLRLFKFLKENGEDVSDNNAMDVKIKQVDFEPWALEYADFLRKSVHQGNEVAMAFFPRRPVKAILEDSHQQDMAKIQLSDLQGDRQVEFDLYVFLPANNKFVLYTPKGGVFYNKQMDRLKKQGVTHMHVQKEAAQAVSKYQAQNYLNDMVEDFEQKQEAIAKVKAAS